jgi:hypothetical protein
MTSQRVLITRVGKLTTNWGASGSISDKLESADGNSKSANQQFACGDNMSGSPSGKPRCTANPSSAV